MATRIKLKRSTTPLAAPTTSDLLDGEVALNIADRKLYARNGASIVEVANYVPNTGTVTTDMLATDLTNGPGQTYYVAKTGSDATTLGNGGANGKHPDTPFLTLTKALATAVSGDKIIVESGTYTEVFPLTVPDGVTIRGSGLRAVRIEPTSGTKTQNGFILNGDTTLSDFTIGGIQYDSVNDRGYAFVCASNWDSTRSAYIERVTVLNKGSVTPAGDPFGYAQGDAGRGAKLDGALSASANYEPAVLFNECTFFTPNQIGLYMTNGIRVELLNSFFYFASEAIKGVSGATGVAGAGKTRLKLGGVSGTFSASEDIYQLEDNFNSGTYSQTGTAVTVTKANHGLSNGDKVYADYTTGSAIDGFFTVSSAATNTFVLTAAASATTSGNIQYKKAEAYGTVSSNDGTYVYLSNKGTGEFTSTVEGNKTVVVSGDAKLSTAQYKFGTASLITDGVGDYISLVSDTDFGYGVGNFTVEMWVRRTGTGDYQTLFDQRVSADTEVALLIGINPSNQVYTYINGAIRNQGTTALASNAWYHIALCRSGSNTRLFVNGVQEGATYTDNNNYAAKPIRMGLNYNNAYGYSGYIDEVRISTTDRYTATFTPSASAFTTDIYTVLLLHLDGANAGTNLLDSAGTIKDIRSSGGDSATSILLADYTDFGAELRSIGCAAVYGNKGVVADGLGVSLRLTAVNFEYIGTGKDITNDISGVVQANEVTELNGGRVYFSSQDQSGNFRVGDQFLVDQETGNVTFTSTSNAQQAANIILSDNTGTTSLYPAYIETGNLRLSGNTLSSNSGQIILDPSANEDIVLNAEVISSEELFFDSSKKAGITSSYEGAIDFRVNGDTRAGFNSSGLFSSENIAVYYNEIDTITKTVEGNRYPGGTFSVDVSTPPLRSASVTAVLSSTGTVKRISVTNQGSLYTTAPTVGFSSGTAQASAILLTTAGSVVEVNIQSPGSNYTSPTVTFASPPNHLFNAGLISANRIDFGNAPAPFSNGDYVTYSNNGNTTIVGLTNGSQYYVVNKQPNSFQLSLTSGGVPINITAGTSQHTLTGETATATVASSGGAITGFTITNKGSGYTSSPVITLTGGSGVGFIGSAVVGYPINSTVNVTNPGTSYASAPSVTFTRAGTDTTGINAAASSVLGYEIDSINVSDYGYGYVKEPEVVFSGGNPTTPASAESILDNTKGIVSSFILSTPGAGYESTPTVSLVGGSGSDATGSLEIQSVAGTIQSGGSGYTPGTYSNIQFTGGSGSGASATFFVAGLNGSITTPGSGFDNGTFNAVPVRNNITTTYNVTVVQRQRLQYSVASRIGTFSAGQTVTGSTSGASGVVTYSDNTNGYLYFASVTNGPFANSETITSSGVSATAANNSPQNQVFRYLINGSETPSISLIAGNTYKFSQSDPSNSGHQIIFANLPVGANPGDPPFVVQNALGSPGDSGSYTELILKTGFTSSNTITYECSTHGSSQGLGGFVNVSSGSVGVYGSGATANITVSAGAITSLVFVNQGTGYKVGDIVTVFGKNFGLSVGSGFQYTINTNDTSISSVSDISLIGSGYQVNDSLSVNPSNVGGTGAGFSFTVNKVGFVKQLVLSNKGRNFYPGDILQISGPNAPTTAGTPFTLTVNTVTPVKSSEISWDGSVTLENTTIDQTGTININAGSVVLQDNGNISNSGTLTTSGATSLQSTLQVLGVTTLTGNLNANGSSNSILNSTISINDGTDANPSFRFQNSQTTGLFRQAPNVIGVAISGAEKGRFGATNWYLGSNLNIDSVVGAATPFFTVDQSSEIVKIGDSQTQLQINNDASIQAIGTNTNVGIRFEPKGTGSFTLTGASNRSFLINDGLVNTFTVDTFTGNTNISGKLQINSELQLEDNVISNIDQVSTVSFGQITSVSATGTATGYTDGTYTAVTSTTNGIGTGATFNVTVSGGNITSVAVNAGGRNYKEGDTITLSTATIGAGSGKTITVTDVAGAGISIKPQTNKSVKIDSNASLIIPSGTTNERPPVGDRFAGAIRFNVTQQQFEGYNGSDFVSLGGVRDVDQNTYLLTELSPGSNENTFFFYNDGVNSLDITQNEIKLYTARTIRTTTLTINNSSSPLDVQYNGTSVLRVRSQRDVEVSNGLRLKYVPQLGAIATRGTVNSVIAGYTPSQTYTGVVSTSDGEGTGATFNVTTDASGNINSVTINAAGTGYAVGDKITIAGNLVGGTTPAKDVTFLVVTISGAAAAYSRLDTLTSDFRFTLNSGKEFISLDQGVSNAGLKVNQNYAAGGATSYLTVLDSSAAFVELNDVRVEGAAISSFSTSSSIVQFVKTSYKGAKTLITIESNDNKVQMLEVTSICASNGVTAYATITNSVTSHNDLVDAAVNVSGNNVVISLTKSSAATSSTTFTGRYTTTKVKA